MQLIEDINIRKLLEKTQMKMLSDAYKETSENFVKNSSLPSMKKGMMPA